MTVLDFLRRNLKTYGYDGLYNLAGECACLVSDLAPCSNLDADHCHPGYRAPCDCGEGCDFHIVEKKP